MFAYEKTPWIITVNQWCILEWGAFKQKASKRVIRVFTHVFTIRTFYEAKANFLQTLNPQSQMQMQNYLITSQSGILASKLTNMQR